jgi:hypothetical protein
MFVRGLTKDFVADNKNLSKCILDENLLYYFTDSIIIDICIFLAHVRFITLCYFIPKTNFTTNVESYNHDHVNAVSKHLVQYIVLKLEKRLNSSHSTDSGN